MEEDEFIIKNHPFGGIGDLLILEDWLELVRDGMFCDYDGHGDAIRWVDSEAEILEKIVRPSQAERLPKETTHILWYNK